MRRITAIVLAMLMLLALSAAAYADVPSGVEDGVLTIAMECAYAPYNWTQPDDSNRHSSFPPFPSNSNDRI